MDAADIQQRALVHLLREHGPLTLPEIGQEPITADSVIGSDYEDLYITGAHNGKVTVGVLGALDENGVFHLPIPA